MAVVNLGLNGVDPIRQGATYTLSCTVYSGTSTGAAMNLTNYTLAGKLKQHYDSTATAATFTMSLVMATAGKIQGQLASTVTGALTAQRYVYDWVITSTAGVKTRVLEGCAYVSGGVSST